MTRTVVALYDDITAANAAVRDLRDNGFSRDDISLMATDATGDYSRSIGSQAGMTDMGTSGAAEGAGVGAGIGAVLGGLGGLLVGLGALTIPGIGPVVAAGPLSAALAGLAGAGVGAVAGGVTGGLLGALVDMGIPEETAQYYAEGIRRGGILVTVRTSDTMTDHAVDILNKHNPVDINERASQWRQTGWTRFDPNAEPYRVTATSSDMNRTPQTDWPRGTYHPEEGGEMSEPRFSEDRPDLWRPERGGNTEDDMIEGTYNDFDDYDTRFRTHYETTFATMGYTYDQYQPAYRYGYDLATDERYRDFDWNRLEPEARRYWDERNPGTWDRVKTAIRHAWEEIKDTVS